MKKIEHIIFDFGGVLYTIDFELLMAEFKKLELPQNLWDDKQNNIFLQLERGEMPANKFLDLLQLASPMNPDLKEVHEAFCSMLIGMPVENLRYLRRISRNYPCYLLSNTNEIHFDFFSRQILADPQTEPFYKSFKKEYYSHKLGLRKPDHRIYEYVLNDSNLDAENTLFVDDMSTNIEEARNCGLQVFHFGTEGEWAEMIEKFQLKI